jgi:hypothetical protein
MNYACRCAHGKIDQKRDTLSRKMLLKIEKMIVAIDARASGTGLCIERIRSCLSSQLPEAELILAAAE